MALVRMAVWVGLASWGWLLLMRGEAVALYKGLHVMAKMMVWWWWHVVLVVISGMCMWWW